MTTLFQKQIEKASFVAIMVEQNVDVDALGSASALYSYMLQLHKKVVLVSQKSSFEKNLYVIPWLKKAKKELPKGVDLILTCKDIYQENSAIPVFVLNNENKDIIATVQVIYELFICLHVKINSKMATALYAGLVSKTKMFTLKNVNGIIFALAKELIELGADHQNVVKYLQKYSTLSQVRLLGKMLLEMELLDDARIAFFSVTDEMLLSFGASVDDCEEAMQKALELPTVEFSILVVQTEDLHVKAFFRSDRNNTFWNIKDFGTDISQKEAKEKILVEVRKIEKKESK